MANILSRLAALEAAVGKLTEEQIEEMGRATFAEANLIEAFATLAARVTIVETEIGTDDSVPGAAAEVVFHVGTPHHT